MPVKRAVKRPKKYDQGEVDETFEQWSVIKKEKDALDARLKVLRDRLVDHLETYGEPDDKGNLRLPLGQEIDGIGGLKFEKRTSRPLNEDAAEKILGKKGLLEQCQVEIVVLNEAEIEALHFKDEISEEEYDEIFPRVENWAFKQEKA